MHMLVPAEVLFAGEMPPPVMPVVDHYAGTETRMRKALALQRETGPLFDITCDCEDGAPAGAEAEHAHLCAELILGAENRHGRVGARIHDITHPHWERDLEILVGTAGKRLAFVTLPKVRSANDAARQIAALRALESRHGLVRPIPAHVLIETHGALREIWQISALENVECLDFGIMDFISAHHGAIPASAMRSPDQFEHPLIVRAKCEIAAAALAFGRVPAHNVTTELSNTDAVYQDARLARKFGFLRMWSIHPNQIDPILKAMRPDFSETETAIAILTAAQEAGWGPIRHAGKLHDRASFRYYWTLLQRAHATGVLLAEDESVQRFGLATPEFSRSRPVWR
ncbi:MAG: CoA ester lyase [Zoogloeaceae bacterium]|nr:CoA ester lyase [Zoogloeaceae bacterium]